MIHLTVRKRLQVTLFSMCISASVSYSAAVVLVSTGLYAVQQAIRLPPAYWLWALVPILFGLQQGFEGRLWQILDAGDANSENASEALAYALGFHFFSHFLWPWWIPMCSYFVEPGIIRKRIFAACAIFGAFSGTLVYVTMLFHPEWMTVSVQDHAIIYNLTVPNLDYIPYLSNIHLPITPLMLYGLIILAPLLISSHRQIQIFGGLVALSSLLASMVVNEAFVSVWCFFAAVLSLYLVNMIRRYATGSGR